MSEPTPNMLSYLGADVEFALCSDNTIDFRGEKYTPDATKGYFQFQIATAFPQGVHTTGCAIYSGTVARSYESMLRQNINYEHRIKSYYNELGKPNNVEDHVIGCVLAVDYPHAPAMGWRLDSRDAPPSISGLGVLFKQTTGMQQIIGNHQAGRHKYTVSMEADYRHMDSGIAIATNGGKQLFDTTPDHFAAAGYDYVPVAEAPEELLAALTQKGRAMSVKKKYRNRPVAYLMGGLTGSVHFAGVGVVKYGAERTAQITRVTASNDRLLIPLALFAHECEKFARGVLRQEC